MYTVHAYNRHKQFSGSQIGPQVSSTVVIFILEDVSLFSSQKMSQQIQHLSFKPNVALAFLKRPGGGGRQRIPLTK